MARLRLGKTLMDYMVIAITPVLIMLLVGSLTFFLLTVFYLGSMTRAYGSFSPALSLQSY